MSLLAMAVAGNTFHLEKRQTRQPLAQYWWMSSVIATMQPMQLGALAVKSALGLDFSESFHRDLQGRVSKEINGCYLPCPSACPGLCQRVYFISPSFSLLFCSVEDFRKDPPSKLSRKSSLGHWRGCTLKAWRLHQPVLKCGLRNAAPLPDMSHPASRTLTDGHHGDWVKHLRKMIWENIFFFLPISFLSLPSACLSPFSFSSPQVTCISRIK